MLPHPLGARATLLRGGGRTLRLGALRTLGLGLGLGALSTLKLKVGALSMLGLKLGALRARRIGNWQKKTGWR